MQDLVFLGAGGERIEVLNGGRIKSADLGGGDDTFVLTRLNFFVVPNAPAIEGTIDGGSGYNSLHF